MYHPIMTTTVSEAGVLNLITWSHNLQVRDLCSLVTATIHVCTFSFLVT